MRRIGVSIAPQQRKVLSLAITNSLPSADDMITPSTLRPSDVEELRTNFSAVATLIVTDVGRLSAGCIRRMPSVNTKRWSQKSEVDFGGEFERFVEARCLYLVFFHLEFPEN
jgi:hypothetical protein